MPDSSVSVPAEVLEALQTHDRILIAAHANPDGDAVGASRSGRPSRPGRSSRAEYGSKRITRHTTMDPGSNIFISIHGIRDLQL